MNKLGGDKEPKRGIIGRADRESLNIGLSVDIMALRKSLFIYTRNVWGGKENA